MRTKPQNHFIHFRLTPIKQLKERKKKKIIFHNPQSNAPIGNVKVNYMISYSLGVGSLHAMINELKLLSSYIYIYI